MATCLAVFKPEPPDGDSECTPVDLNSVLNISASSTANSNSNSANRNSVHQNVNSVNRNSNPANQTSNSANRHSNSGNRNSNHVNHNSNPVNSNSLNRNSTLNSNANSNVPEEYAFGDDYLEPKCELTDGDSESVQLPAYDSEEDDPPPPPPPPTQLRLLQQHLQQPVFNNRNNQYRQPTRAPPVGSFMSTGTSNIIRLPANSIIRSGIPGTLGIQGNRRTFIAVRPPIVCGPNGPVGGHPTSTARLPSIIRTNTATATTGAGRGATLLNTNGAQAFHIRAPGAANSYNRPLLLLVRPNQQSGSSSSTTGGTTSTTFGRGTQLINLGPRGGGGSNSSGGSTTPGGGLQGNTTYLLVPSTTGNNSAIPGIPTLRIVPGTGGAGPTFTTVNQFGQQQQRFLVPAVPKNVVPRNAGGGPRVATISTGARGGNALLSNLAPLKKSLKSPYRGLLAAKLNQIPVNSTNGVPTFRATTSVSPSTINISTIKAPNFKALTSKALTSKVPITKAHNIVPKPATISTQAPKRKARVNDFVSEFSVPKKPFYRTSRTSLNAAIIDNNAAPLPDGTSPATPTPTSTSVNPSLPIHRISTYSVFQQLKWRHIKLKNPGVIWGVDKSREITARINDQWRGLKPHERKHFEEEANRRYESKLAKLPIDYDYSHIPLALLEDGGTSEVLPDPQQQIVDPSDPDAPRLKDAPTYSYGSPWSMFTKLEWGKLMSKYKACDPNFRFNNEHFGRVSKRMAKKWRKMTPEEKKPYYEMCKRRATQDVVNDEELRVEFEELKKQEAGVSSSSALSSDSNNNPEFDDAEVKDEEKKKEKVEVEEEMYRPDPPKHDMAASYHLYLKEEWAKLKAQRPPNKKTNKNETKRIQKQISDRWRTMPPEEKQRYYDETMSPLQRARAALGPYVPVRDELPVGQIPEVGQITKDEPLCGQNSDNKVNASDAAVDVDQLSSGGGQVESGDVGQSTEKKLPNGQSSDNEVDVQNTNDKVCEVGQITEKKPPVVQSPENKLPNGQSTIVDSVDQRNTNDKVPEVGQIAEDERSVGQNLEKKLSVVQSSENNKLPNDQSTDELPNGATIITSTSDNESLLRVDQKRPVDKITNEDDVVLPVELQNTTNTNDKVPEVGQTLEDDKLPEVQSTNDDNKLPNGIDNEQPFVVDQNSRDTLSVVRSTDDDPVIDTDAKLPEAGQTTEPSLDNQNNTEEDKQSPENPITNNDNNKVLDEVGQITEENERPVDQSTEEKLPVVQNTENTELPNTTQSTENELQVNKISQDNDVSRSTDDNLVDTTELDHSTEDQLDPLDQNSTGDKRSDDQIAQDPVPVVQTPVNDNLSVDDQISKKNVPTVDQTLEDNLPIADQTPVDVLPVVVPRTDDQQISNVLETSEEIEEATQSDQSSTTKNSNKPQLLNSKMAEKIEQFRKLNAKFKALKATTTKNSSSTGSAFNKASTSKTTTSTSGSEVPEESEDFDDDSFSFGSLPGDDFDYDNYDFDNSGDDGDEEEDGNDDDELSIEGRESTSSKPETPSKRNLTPRQLEVRREQNRARWAALAPEERAAVNALKRTRFAAKNLGSGTSGGEEPAPETESTDEYMRGYMRKYMRDRRSAETDKQHRRRLDKSKEYAQRKKLMRLAGFETDEEREKRLAKNRRTVEKRKERKAAAATSSASESSSSLSSGLDSTNTSAHAQTFGSTTPVLEYRITTSSETSITLKSTKLPVVATSTITSDGALDSTTPRGNFTEIPNGKVSESIVAPTIDDDEDVGDVSDFGDAPMGYDDDDSGEDYREDKDEETSKSASTEVATPAVIVETKIDTIISGCDDEENIQEKKEEIPPFMEDSGEETEIDDEQPPAEEVENNTEKLLEEENSQVKEVLEKDAPEGVDSEKDDETNIKAPNIEEQQSPEVTEKSEDLEIINKRKEVEEKDNNNTEKLLEEENSKLKEVLEKEQAPQEVVDDEEVAAKQMYEKVIAQIDGNSTTQPEQVVDKEDTEDNEKVSESSPKEHHHHQNEKGHKRKKKHSQKEHKHEQPKKPRGRPRKYPKPEVVIEKEDNDDDATDIDEPVIDEVTPPPPPPPPVVLPVKRGRGRPRKHPLPTPTPLPIVVLQQLTSAIISTDKDKVPDKDEAIREKVSENLQILPSEKVLLSEKKPEKDRVILEKVSENRDQVIPGGKVSEKVSQIQEKVPDKDEIIPEKVSNNLQIRPSEKVPENRDQVLPGEKLPVKVPQIQEKVPEKIVDMDNSLNNLDLGVDVPMLMDDDVLNRTMEEIFSTDNPFNSNTNAQQSLAFQPPPPPPQPYQQPHQQHHHQPPPPLPFQQYPMPLPDATSTNNQQPHYINGVYVNSAYNSTPSASYSHHHNPYSMYPQEYSAHHHQHHQGYYDNQHNQQQNQQQQHWNANSGSYGSTGFPGSGYGTNMFGFVDPNSVPNSVIQSQSSSPFQQPPIETMMNVPPIVPNSAFSNGYGQHGPFMHAVTPMSCTGSPAHSYGSNGSSSMNTVPLSTAASPNVSTSHLAVTNSYNGSSNGPSINAVPLSTASPSVSSNLLSNGYDGHRGPFMDSVTSLSSTASSSNTSIPSTIVSTPISTTNPILSNGYASNGSSINTVLPPGTASPSTVSPNSNNNTVLTLSSTNHILPNGSSNGSFTNPVPLGTPSTTSTNTITSCTSTITTASTSASSPSPTPSTPLNGHHRIEANNNVNNETSNIETVTVSLSPTVPIANTFAPFIPTPVVKRGRGRPRKYPQVVMPVKHVFNPHASFNFAASTPSPSAAPQPATEAVAADATTTPTLPVKRGRGRPRKHPLPAPPAVVAALEKEEEKLMPKKKKKVIIDDDDNEKPSKSSRSSTRKASIDDSQSSSSQPSTPVGGKGSKMTTKMPNETEEEFRERKRTYMREYQRARRATETPEEKRKRLDQVRLYEERRKLKRLAGLETEDEKVKRLRKNQRIGLLKRVKRGRKCKVQVKEEDEDEEDEEYSTSVIDDDNDGTTEEDEEEVEDTKELTISQKVSEKEDIEKLTGKNLGL